MTIISNYLDQQAELANQDITNIADHKTKEILQQELSHIHTYNTAYQDATTDFIRIIGGVTHLAVQAVNPMGASDIIRLLIDELANNTSSQDQAHQELVETYTKKLGSI
jgi:hypothetical protein